MANLSNKVQQLIKAKKYTEAKELLAHSDHRLAVDWIKRIEALQAVQAVQKEKDKQRGVQLAVGCFFACILSCAVIWIWGTLFPDENAAIKGHITRACAAVMTIGEAIDHCDTDYILEYHAGAVAFCEPYYDKDNPLAPDLYAVCLKMQGVDMRF